MEFRDLKKQYQGLKADMDKAVIEVMTDCNFISGRQVKELEEKLATYVGVKHCISCGNGTDALTMIGTARSKCRYTAASMAIKSRQRLLEDQWRDESRPTETQMIVIGIQQLAFSHA